MDRGVTLDSKAEINGRNMWILWTGGNDRFWDISATLSFGNVDLLKTVSSYDPDIDSTVDSCEERAAQKKSTNSAARNRWDYLGAVNEPCFQQAQGPNRERYRVVAGSARQYAARRIHLKMKRNIRESSSARAVRIFRLDLTMATASESWAFGCFQIRHSTKLRRRSGTRSDITRTRLITNLMIW